MSLVSGNAHSKGSVIMVSYIPNYIIMYYSYYSHQTNYKCLNNDRSFIVVARAPGFWSSDPDSIPGRCRSISFFKGSGGLMDKVSASQHRDHVFELHTGHDHIFSYDTSTSWFQEVDSSDFRTCFTIELK